MWRVVYFVNDQFEAAVQGLADLGLALLIAILRGLTGLEHLAERVSPRAVAAAVLVFLAGLGLAGGLVAGRDPRPDAVKAAAPSLITFVKARVTPEPGPLQASTAPPPQALQDRLDELARQYGDHVGIAVADVSEGWVAQVSGEQAFPQQSVSKLWVAVTAMDAVDRGQITLDQAVVLGPRDRSVFYQPIAHKIGATGYATTLRDLLQRALIESDNAANDKLLSEVGGVPAVTDTLARKRIGGIRLGADEKDLQSQIAGLTWSPELGIGGAFKEARALLTDEARDTAMQAYLDNPMDGATPVGVVLALRALKRGELLSRQSTDTILATMAQARTGPRRLAGGLPDSWSIAHKTGTGQDWRGGSIGINDVAVLTAPDGRSYAVAVLMKRTTKPIGARLAFMQSVSRAVVSSWEADRRTLASLRPSTYEASGR